MGGFGSGGGNSRPPDEHLARGTFRPARHGGVDVPDSPKGRPSPPRTLAGEARAEWDRMVHRLEQTNALSLVDDAALYQYVQLHAETEAIQVDYLATRKLSAELKTLSRKLEGPELVEAVKEIVKLQSLLGKHSQRLRAGRMALRQFLGEFGMTPASRTRVKTRTTEKKPGKLVAFLGGKAGTRDGGAGDA